ncbi:PAS domain S-box protein [Limisalsivibrio acetivorans]|uniref:PAS domain S-box protein n=1 Tax=Limisalsivibrio acetivorans TaxID=1304888 RepID=UPI0003B4C747|nr:PAS domain S-box protein [Limisalsivibrio acetivorans]
MKKLLIAAVAAAGIAASMFTGFYFTSSILAYISEHNKEDAEELVEVTSTMLDQFFTARKSEIAMLSNTPSVQSMDWERMKPFLLREQERLSNTYDKLFIAYPDGRVHSTKDGNPFQDGYVSYDDSSPDSELISIKHREYWKNTVHRNGGRHVIDISKLMFEVLSGQRQVVIASTILSGKGETLGMIAGSIEWYFLDKRLERMTERIKSRFGDESYISIFNSDGTYIYHSRAEEAAHRQFDDDGHLIPVAPKVEGDSSLYKHWEALLQNKKGSFFYSSNNRRILVHHHRIESADYIITLHIPAESISRVDSITLELAIPAVLAGAATAILVLIASLYLMRRKIAGINSALIGGGEVFDSDFSDAVSHLRRMQDDYGDLVNKWELLSRHTSEVEYWFSPDGSLAFISPKCVELTGYEPEEFYADPTLIDALIHQDDLDKWFRYKSGPGESTDVVLRINGRGRGVKWVRAFCTEVPCGEQGKPVLRGSFRDISERMETERKLRESEQQFKKLFMKNGAVMLIVDPVSGVVGDANNSAAEFFSLERQDLINHNIEDFLDAGEGEYNTFSLDKMINSGSVGILMPDSTRKDCEIHSTLIRFGEQIQLFLIIIDVSKKKELSELLEEREEMFRTLAEYNVAGVALFTEQIIYSNPVLEDITGYSTEELQKLSPWELVAPEGAPKIKDVCFKALYGDKKVRKYRDVRITHKSGREKSVFFFLTSVPYKGRSAGLVTFVDITEISEIQEQLEKRVNEEIEKRRHQEQLLINQSRLASMGEMIGAIAHHWRQPLNTIGLFVQDLEDAFEYEETDRQYIKDTVRDTMHYVTRLSKTIDDFRDFFKPSGILSDFDASDAVEDVLKLLRDRFELEGIQIKLYTDKEQDHTVTGYKSEFRQVILNIINNSRDAVVEKYTKLSEECKGLVEITVENIDNKVSVAITDNGGGVNPVYIMKVFDPYFTTKEEGQGIGMGLFMSKTIIEKNMGGQITLENHNNGALVRILLKKTPAQ